MSTEKMTYQEKIDQLTKAIAQWVEFNDLLQAEETVNWYNQPANSYIRKRIPEFAEELYRDAEVLGITRLIQNIGHCKRTKLSALREAIRQCAQQYVSQVLNVADVPQTRPAMN